jgi:hypothetical protein
MKWNVWFTSNGIWISSDDTGIFRFNGSVVEFLSILVYHKELDISDTRFLVTEWL